MAKMNWQKTQTQNRSFRYGLEIDPTVAADPSRAPKYSIPMKKARQNIENNEKPDIIDITSSKIVELMGIIKSEIGLNEIGNLDKLVKELHSNIIKLDKLRRSTESVKLMETAHHLLKNALLFNVCSKNNPNRAKLIAESIADNSGNAPENL